MFTRTHNLAVMDTQTDNKIAEWPEELKTRSILVVDDTPDSLRFVAGILSEQGCKAVRLSPNGKHALATINKKIPDLVLLDVNMPDINGYEVCRRLKADEKTKDIAVIFLTGLDDEEAEVKGFGLGAVDFVTKPIQAQPLLARVRTHLELAAAKKQLQEQNKELIKAGELREEVERIMQHDLKNPLHIIIGCTTLLRDELELNEEHKEFIESIVDASYRILKMIDSSLDLYKMETGAYRFVPDYFNVTPAINRNWESCSKKFQYKSLDFSLTIDNKKVDGKLEYKLWGEELLVYSLLGNLILNATAAAPKNTTISVSLNRKDDAFEMEIHNQGAVPEEIREQFFDKYATSGKTSGTGIGTYSASLIAKIHGGNISMSSSEADGTTITIHLPAGPDS